jgi:CRISPR-associated endonuclease/helicase Cas3
VTPGVRIQSHFEPKRYLQQHVAEILAASEAILEQHGPAPWRALGGDDLLPLLARAHDLGKGSAAFQQYIADPPGYGGDPREKAHTLLSLVLSIAWGAAEGLSPDRLVAVALAVRGHHGGQPSDDRLFLDLAGDEDREALCRQLPTVNLAALARETGLTLPPGTEDPELDVRRAMKALRRAVEALRRLDVDERARVRFVARAAYSVLLEADKAFLAVDRESVRAYLHRARPTLHAGLVDAHRGSLGHTPMDELRAEALARAGAGFERCAGEPLLTLTLPTGAGKTLLAARWALAERVKDAAPERDTPMVIVALPMLSIVDQTERVYREVLGADGGADGELLLAYHSLSERAYDPELEAGTADFFIDTWRSEVVVTTFDQLLLALYSDRAKHAMRYHRLLNARIVIDEVQCVPPVLWTAMREGLAALTKLGRTRVLAMSATPSPCLAGAAPVLEDPAALYSALSRYELHIDVAARVSFEAFVAEVTARCRDNGGRGEGTLVTVNTRATAQETWERLSAAGLDPWLLSGDMTPEHRLSVIARLKADPVRVVVSTQCVEAGVDLDMHHVIRDFAPLDALVQIAGRCNRHAHRSAPGTVTVLHLRDARGHDNAATIYDEILLQCTREVLAGRAVVSEREVLALCVDYFGRVAARKNSGQGLFEGWTRIEQALDVARLLRGRDESRQVLVMERDPDLRGELRAALAVQDRWMRRSALRALAGRIAKSTVSVSERVLAGLRTAPLDRWATWSELLPGQYDGVRGIDSRVKG